MESTIHISTFQLTEVHGIRHKRVDLSEISSTTFLDWKTPDDYDEALL